MRISNLTTTLVGEKEKTLPLIHETERTLLDDGNIVECGVTVSNGTDSVIVEFFYETDDWKAGKETEPRKYAPRIMELERYNSRLKALGDDIQVIDIRVSPINIVSIN